MKILKIIAPDRSRVFEGFLLTRFGGFTKTEGEGYWIDDRGAVSKDAAHIYEIGLPKGEVDLNEIDRVFFSIFDREKANYKSLQIAEVYIKTRKEVERNE